MNRDLFAEFKVLVTNTLAPTFKGIGFKKSNLNFSRTVNDIVQCVNVQRSQWNHTDRVLFTLNLGLYNDELFRKLKCKTESPKFIREVNCFAWVRSGHLIYKHDYWYELSSDVSYEQLRTQLENDINGHIIPLFNELNSLNSLIELFRIDFYSRKFPLIADIDDVAVMELGFGDYERGKKIIVDMHEEALIPKSVKSATIYPDGREEVRWSEPQVNEFAIEKYKRIAKTYSIDL